MTLKHSVACCFLTHNHTDALSEILDRCLKVYSEYEIDICIYDDSDDDSTKNLIYDLINKGATNLFYIDAHEAQTGDDKYLLAIQGYGLPKAYDYIWPSKDRVCFDEAFIKRVRNAIEEGHDAVVGALSSYRDTLPVVLTVAVVFRDSSTARTDRI